MSMRDEFERWVCNEYDLDIAEVRDSRSIDDDGVSGYGDPDIDSDDDCMLTAMWFSWQAARAQQSTKGDAVAMGNLSFDPEDHYKNAVLIQFASPEECREALNAGQCRFTVFGGEV